MSWTTIALIGIAAIVFIAVLFTVVGLYAFWRISKMQDRFFDKDDDFFGRR